jgi:arsenate reductase
MILVAIPTLVVANSFCKMDKILVLCTGNSCRSQMAEGFLRKHAADLTKSVAVVSAGVETHGLNQRAVAVMGEAGIDITGHTSDLVDMYLDKGVTHVITVCDNARESCPIFPGDAAFTHHSFPDPAGATGNEAAIMQEFRAVRDLVDAYSKQYVIENF